MIIKILSSAKNFEGIDYSERKNDQGKSRLLKAKNFEALGHSSDSLKKSDYINYMKLVCDANPRVKNRQFHAVISAKGQSYSPEKLSQIAERYLHDLGYGKNPYLIYFHGDTENNHVHMVSTRVDKNGNKVDYIYEKIRSQKFIQQIMGKCAAQEVSAAFEKAMKFNFSTKAQLKLLIELVQLIMTVFDLFLTQVFQLVIILVIAGKSGSCGIKLPQGVQIGVQGFLEFFIFSVLLSENQTSSPESKDQDNQKYK